MAEILIHKNVANSESQGFCYSSRKSAIRDLSVHIIIYIYIYKYMYYPMIFAIVRMNDPIHDNN